MIKSYVNVMIMMSLAWGLYSYCQKDMVLPLFAGIIVFSSIVMRYRSTQRDFKYFETLPLPIVIIVSFLAGFLWRYIAPIPEDAHSPWLDYVSAMQSGSIVAATLISLKPFSKKNMYLLVACAWLTVALSVNVPFDNSMLLSFASFSFIAIAIVIINTMHAPPNKKYAWVYAKDYVIYSALLIALTTVFFLAFTSLIVIMETAFFNTMSQYILPRHYTHFLNVSPNLNLITPGVSAFDRRPVLEITLPKTNLVYLKMQVFDRYNNGIWNEIDNSKKFLLPSHLIANQQRGHLVLFTKLKKLVPMPSGITAIQSNELYFQDDNHLISAKETQNARSFAFSISTAVQQSIHLSPSEYQRYTELPASIAPQLHDIAQSITQSHESAIAKTLKMVAYFHHHFKYSLELDFTADNKGILKMLNEKRPAYCTYFASALALLLRAEGIPTRIASGFLTTEKIDAKKNTFLTRVNNAHAWTEVLLPFYNTQTGQTSLQWQAFDATPPNFNIAKIKKTPSYYVEKVYERIWFSILHMRVWFETTDKDVLKIYGIMGLLMMMAFINRRQIILGLKEWFKQQQFHNRTKYMSPSSLNAIYRQYEHYLLQHFNEVRAPYETDADVLRRIHAKSSKETIFLIKNFIQEYHAARFNSESPENLNPLLQQLKNSK